MDATCIHCDNQSCMKLSENPVFHDKLKHIEIKYHYIKDMVQRGVVKLQYVAMDENIADVLTKPLARVKFEYFKENLGVLQIEVSVARVFTLACANEHLLRKLDSLVAVQ